MAFLERHLQGSAFVILMMLTTPDHKWWLIAWMVGVSFSPRHFWWFL